MTDDPYHDTNQRDYERYKDESAQRLQFQHDYAQASLKSSILVNGGAIVALFTFAGHDQAAISGYALWWSFGWFVFALAAGLFAHLGAFMSQAFFMNVAEYAAISSRNAMAELQDAAGHGADERRYRGYGNITIGLALGASVLSLVGFVIGAACALSGLR